MLNRSITSIVNYFLDNICPPILREVKWLMHLIIWFAYGSTTKKVMEFKDKSPFLSEEEIASYYEQIKDAPINKRATDLNPACLSYILANIKGDTILDAACGRGYLIRQLLKRHNNISISGVDIVLDATCDFTCIQANITNLPFEDKSFDTVICTHALEHVRNCKQALFELIRVAKKELS